MNQTAMDPSERKTASSLALVFSMRMLGLFMIMPVFATYGQDLEGYSPFWVGLAIGAYGLTQAILQIPMGWLSDKFGRKPVIYVGLAIFAIGSLVAANADSVYMVTLGRFIQGMGAVASAILALAADSTRHEHRAKAMGTIGVSIGISFAVALVAGPVLAQSVGLSGIFYITALLAVLGMLIVYFFVPTPTVHSNADRKLSKKLFKKLTTHPELLRLNLGIFILHMTLTALFIAIPLELLQSNVSKESHWMIYFPALLGSFIFMIPLLIMASKKGQQRLYFLGAIMLMAVALVLMILGGGNAAMLFFAVLVYFTAFNYLEASLPALISMIAPAGNKGAAMGVYSSFQFSGAFFGGLVGGLWLNNFSSQGLFLAVLIILVAWFVLAFGMKERSGIRSICLSIPESTEQEADDLLTELKKLEGVDEAVIIRDENTAYLKVQRHQFDMSQALAITAAR